MLAGIWCSALLVRLATVVQQFSAAEGIPIRFLPLGVIQFLSSGPEDCEPSVEPEDFGKGGVGVEVESEYDLELRIDGNVGRPGMGYSSFLTVLNRALRW